MTDPAQQSQNDDQLRAMLSRTGYSDKAIDYFIQKPHMGFIADADQVSEMVGTCGDSMTVFLKMNNGRVEDVKYQILGCAGAISAAMAAVDLVKGKTVEAALALNDGDVYQSLEEIPVKKHHCIQLAVKALQKAIKDYQDSNGSGSMIAAKVPAGPFLSAEKSADGSACCADDAHKGGCAGTGDCCKKSED